MRAAGDGQHGRRLRGLIVILWRAGLRIHAELALTEADLDHRRGALLVRRGKGGRRREVGMDPWGMGGAPAHDKALLQGRLRWRDPDSNRDERREMRPLASPASPPSPRQGA